MFKAFVYEQNGILYLSNGQDEIYFDPGEFKEFEPNFSLPSGVVAVNYEYRGDKLEIYTYTRPNGLTQTMTGINPQYEEYIDKLQEYLPQYRERRHPMYGVSADDARLILLELKVTLFNKKVMEGGKPPLAIYNDTEKDTWHIQEQEALMWSSDQNVETPFLDAVRLDGESKAEQVQKVLNNANSERERNAVMLKHKREQRQRIANLPIEAVRQEYDALIEQMQKEQA